MATAPNVGQSNADIFRNIIDYRLERKQEIFDYLKSAEDKKFDPQVIAQQYQLLRIQEERLSQMDKDLTDIRQGIISSSAGVLKNLVSGRAMIAATTIRASTDIATAKLESRQAFSKEVSTYEEDGSKDAGAKLTEALKFAADHTSGGTVDDLNKKLKELYDTTYAAGRAKYDGNAIAQMAYDKKFGEHVREILSSQRFQTDTALMADLKAKRINVNDLINAATSGAVTAEPTASEILAEKNRQIDDFNREVDDMVTNPGGGVRAPTFSERAGVGKSPQAIEAANKKAYLGRMKIANADLFGKDRRLLDTPEAKAKWDSIVNGTGEYLGGYETWRASTPDNEKLFYMDDVNVDKEVDRVLFSSALDTEIAGMKDTKRTSIADLETQTVIDYNRMYGNKKQRELINRYERAGELLAGTDLSQDRIFGNILERAVDKSTRGLPLSRGFVKDMIREELAMVDAGRSGNRTPDIIPPRRFHGKTVNDMLINGFAIRRPKDGAIVVQGTGLVGDTVLRTGDEAAFRISDEDIKKRKEAAAAEAAAASVPQDLTEMTRAEIAKVDAETRRRLSLPEPAPSEQLKSSDRVKDLSADIQKYSGKKYSELVPAEQAHLDSVANELVKLHSEAVRKAPSAEVDRTLQEIGSNVEAIKAMDDVNDYNSKEAKLAMEAGTSHAKKKGHGASLAINESLKPSSSTKEQKASILFNDVAEGTTKASKLYNDSIAADKPIDVSKGSLPKEKLDAVKLIATAPVKVSGKELDSNLEKIAGDSWSIPSERSKYRQWYTTFTVLG